MSRKATGPLCAALLLAGCISLPAPRGQTSMSYHVGDAGAVPVTEVVVSVPVGEGGDAYRNLHVSFSALVNAKRISLSDRYEAERIVRRSSTRLSSVIVKEIAGHGVVRVRDLPALRETLAGTAQQAFDSVFAKWKRADSFSVEIVVTSIYMTDGSVGRSDGGARVMW